MINGKDKKSIERTSLFIYYYYCTFSAICIKLQKLFILCDEEYVIIKFQRNIIVVINYNKNLGNIRLTELGNE